MASEMAFSTFRGRFDMPKPRQFNILITRNSHFKSPITAISIPQSRVGNIQQSLCLERINPYTFILLFKGLERVEGCFTSLSTPVPLPVMHTLTPRCLYKHLTCLKPRRPTYMEDNLCQM